MKNEISSKTKGNELENVVQCIYQAILNSEGYNIEVKRNVTLIGKSGASSEFDIFWVFQIAGETHKVAIECKNYSNTLSVDKVREFSAKLNDFNGIRGIMVTRVGYQQGAIDFAKYNGISLKRFQLVDEMDWSNCFKDITVNLYCINPIQYHTTINTRNNVLDTEQNSIELIHLLQTANIHKQDIPIYDAHGVQFTSLENILKPLKCNEFNEQYTHVYTPPCEAFIHITDTKTIQIQSIDVSYIQRRTVNSFTVRAADYIRGYLLDENDKLNSYLCFKDGKVMKNTLTQKASLSY